MDKDTFMQASGVPLLGEPFEMPEDAALLEPHERDAVRSVISAFIQNHRREQKESDGNADSTAPNRTAGDVFPAHDDELAKRRDLTQYQIDTLDHAAAPEVPDIRPDQDIE